MARAASSEPIVQFTDASVFSNDTLTFEGTTTVDTANTALESIAGYTMLLDVQPRAGAVGSIAFTGVTDVPGALIDSTFGPQMLTVNDGTFVSDATDGGTINLTDSALFEISFSIAPGTTGNFDVHFILAPPAAVGSELQDAEGLPVAATFMDGVIHVTVPEPAGWWIGAGLCIALRRRARSVRTLSDFEF